MFTFEYHMILKKGRGKYVDFKGKQTVVYLPVKWEF